MTGAGFLPFLLPSRWASVLLGAGSPPFVAWLSLVSYRDVRNALHFLTGSEASQLDPTLRAAASREMANGDAGTASVQVGSQRLIVTLVTGLAPQPGAGDG